MKTLIIIILLLCGSTAYNQCFEVQLFDKDKGFDGWSGEGESPPLITSNIVNGTYKIFDKKKLVVFTDIKNSKYNGIYIQYFKNGNIKLIGQYKDNEKIGSWTQFCNNGNILTENVYSKKGWILKTYTYDINDDLKCIYKKTWENRKLDSPPKIDTICVNPVNKLHLKHIEGLDNNLSNDFTLKIDNPNWLLDEYGNNTICLSFWTNKTKTEKGNIGVTVNLVDKKYKDHLIKRKPNYKNSSYKFIETENYIVWISYCSGCGQYYNQLMDVLIAELTMYFSDNKEKL